MRPILTDQEIEEETLQDYLTEIQKTNPQTYHNIRITNTQREIQKITLPPITEIEQYTEHSEEEDYIKIGNKELKYKIYNLYKLFTRINAHTNDKNIKTIITYLKHIEYIIQLIEETEKEKNSIQKNYLEKNLIQLNNELTIFTLKYDKLLNKTKKHTNTEENDPLN